MLQKVQLLCMSHGLPQWTRFLYCVNGICINTFDNMIHPSDAYSGIHDKFGRYISDMVENFLWIFYHKFHVVCCSKQIFRRNIIQKKTFLQYSRLIYCFQ